MAPPPVTPTPHRFLVPKRSQPGSETPKPSFQSSSQQFHATPRFSLPPASRAVPSSSLTPFRHRSPAHDVVVDSSPPPSQRQAYAESLEDDSDNHDIMIDDGYEGHRIAYDEVLLTNGDDMVHGSSPVWDAKSDHVDDDNGEERWAKRRRISASPPYPWADMSSPPPGAQREPNVEMRDTALEIESSFPVSSILSNGVDSDTEEFVGEETGSIPGTPSHVQENNFNKPHRPTFQKAPRFKPTEFSEDAPRPEPLPDAFSPRRKGPKYLAGGLANELRNWLVDVEAGIGSGPMTASTANHDEEWTARIKVDELRGGDGSAQGMTLVLGRLVLDERNNTAGKSPSQGENESEEATEVLDTNTVKLILAGSGRLSGLGVGNDVRPGVLLGIARPTWEVVLEGLGRWGIACDWAVLR